MRRFALAVALVLLPLGSATAAPPKSAAPAKKPASGGKASSAASAKKGNTKAEPRKPSSTSAAAASAERTTNVAVRRAIAGGPTAEDAGMGAESPELAALTAAERELFPPAAPPLGTSWPSDVGYPGPRVNVSGLPEAPQSPVPAAAEAGRDLAWMGKVSLPEFPITWHPRLVRYIEFFTGDPRGRSSITIFARRAGRYENKIRSVLRQKNMPEDLAWLAMVESAYDPRARSPVGAAGLWQFMPETGKVYGLVQDRWADQRFNPNAATAAAADLLSDLKRRFGTWELAMAAYNMGYGGVLGVVRRHNTNDFWALVDQEGSLPWETTLYVPKIMALAVVMKNLELFGFKNLAREASVDGDEVSVPPQTALSVVAEAAGVASKEIDALNPELRAGRTPPDVSYVVKVPRGRGLACQEALAKKNVTPLEQATLRAGETLTELAERHGTTLEKLVELNRLSTNELPRPGTTLLLPKGAKRQAIDAELTAVVPQESFVYPDRKRVFYRVVTGDSVADIAARLGVTVDDLRRWNVIDPNARLQEGMTLQAFVPKGQDLAAVAVYGEEQVRTVSAGTDEFFALWDTKNRSRRVVVAKRGDTLEGLGRTYGVTTGSMERINRRSRRDPLAEGERVVVYLDADARSASNKAAQNAADDDPPPTVGEATVEVLEPLPAQ